MFWMGAHQPSWLRLTDVPLFVSHRRLIRYRQLPRAVGPWALDSGAFSEISQLGRFALTPAAYVDAVNRYAAEVGRLAWAAPQDHMTEPFVLARSHLAATVREAQRWTTDNLLDLRARRPVVPIVPVLQGQTLGDYLDHVDRYAAAGVDLHAEPIVGLGSICRRQATGEIAAIVEALAVGVGLRLHGFGVKLGGLAQYGQLLASADSMAWSVAARRGGPCRHRGARNCANCLTYALDWRTRCAV